MKAVLLCAGYGTRFQPHTNKVAKPALPFLNLPLMAYGAHHLRGLGVSTLLINTHYLSPSVQATAEVLKPFFERIVFSEESPEILGSAGAFDRMRDELEGESEFLVINGDSLFFSTNSNFVADFIEQHKKNQALASFMTCSRAKAGVESSALWINGNNQVQAFGKNIKIQGLSPQHFTGLYCLSSEIFDWIPKDQPSHIFLDVISKVWKEEGFGRTYCDSNDILAWFEVGSLNNYLEATKICLRSLFAHQKNSRMNVLGQTLADCLDFYGKLQQIQFYHQGNSFILSLSLCRRRPSLTVRALLFLGVTTQGAP